MLLLQISISKFISRTCFFAAAAIVGISISPAYSQKVTPTHVYQVATDVFNEVALFHKANHSKAMVDKEAPALTPRAPRHVIQKAREIMVKTQTLRWINNLPQNSVPPVPARNITPGDVIKMLKDVKAAMADLRPKFGIVQKLKPSPMPSKKSPTDVYALLTKISEQVDGLGIPPSLPNDVYQLALTIIGDIKLIRKKAGKNEKIEIEFVSKGKKPGHVFNYGYTLLTDIKSLSETPAYAIKGGVVMPNKRTGRITPGNVAELLNNVLADVAALKIKAGIKVPTHYAGPQAGKTPTNVFDALGAAHKMLKTLG